MYIFVKSIYRAYKLFLEWKDRWADRPFRIIQRLKTSDRYKSPQKCWTPNDNSIFVKVHEHELILFEELILTSFFDI